MKILVLTPRIPWPLRDGGSIAMNQTLEGLVEQGCEVSLLAMNTSRHWVEEAELPALYTQLKHFESVYVNNSINPVSAFLNLFTDKSYNVNRFVNKNFEQALLKLIATEKYDVIHFESIYTSPYLQAVQSITDAKCVCRLHNIEHLIWQGLAEHESNFLKKKYLNLLTGRLRTYEMNVLTKFDLLLPISTKEKDFLEEPRANTCHLLPFGVSDKAIPKVDCELSSCYHIGSMDWAPNVEGVEWFLDEVWSKVVNELPGITFYIAGKNMPASFLSRKEKQVEVVGEVNDFINFSLQKNVMLVPLQSGAGIRIKILEAMELGKTIISTSIGAEGIGAKHREHLLIANTPEEFVHALHECFSNPSLCDSIGKNAREFVSSHFRKQDIYHELVKRYKQLI